MILGGAACGLRLATFFTVHAVGAYDCSAFNKHMGSLRPFKEKLMKTAIKSTRSVILAGAAAALALAAMGFAGAAQARENVFWSVGVSTPGVGVNVGNVGSVYVQPQPVYIQPQPVYVEPAPVYYQPAPVYYQPRPVYVQPAPVYYGRPYGWNRRHEGGRYVQGPRRGYGYGYAPVYYQRDGRHQDRRDDRRENRREDRHDGRR